MYRIYCIAWVCPYVVTCTFWIYWGNHRVSRAPPTSVAPLCHTQHSNPYCTTALPTIFELDSPVSQCKWISSSCALLKGRNYLSNIHYLYLYKELVRREQVSFSASYFVNRQSQKRQFLWFKETGLLMESDAYLEFKWKGDQFLIFFFMQHLHWVTFRFCRCSLFQMDNGGRQVSLRWEKRKAISDASLWKLDNINIRQKKKQPLLFANPSATWRNY